jgi:putative sigma-54 modulation protein
MKIPDNLDSKLVMQGIHIDLTESLQNTIREKFAVILRHNEFILRLNVRLHKNQTQGSDHHYRATAQVEIGGPDMVASTEGKEVYPVLDELVEKLDRLLERRHGRHKDRRNHPQEIELNSDIPKAS